MYRRESRRKRESRSLSCSSGVSIVHTRNEVIEKLKPETWSDQDQQGGWISFKVGLGGPLDLIHPACLGTRVNTSRGSTEAS